MSGFAGVFHLAGTPVDRVWLENMAAFLDFRGPDAREVWVSGAVGLCQTLLRTSAETDGRQQIASLDGRLWLAGDVRIDDREALIAKLPHGACNLKNASSAELILHSYAAWSETCVEHLLGDFSFVIWDAHRRSIFAARDQLGIKPFFYSHLGDYLLVSNTLDCIRQISIVSTNLNEQAIGDHLMAGKNLNPATTFFSDIQRLPSAHRLVARKDRFHMERYWTLPIDEPLYYKRKSDYVDRFRELLRDAVRDRLPDGPLGIFMSGGLDSPAVAATAVQLGASVTAFTSVYDRLIPDQERYYAGLVAQHLSIPIHYDVRDDETFGWEPNSTPIHTPEPSGDPLALLKTRQYLAQLTAQARVFFFGDGPDAALLYEWMSHLAFLTHERRWVRLSRDLAFHLMVHRRVPLLPTLPRMWRERKSKQPDGHETNFLAFLNPEFVKRAGLKERWREINRKVLSPHPIRPKAFTCFVCDFPICGGGNEGVAVGIMEELHPLGDLRLVRFLLAVPVVPWCREKYLIRAAMRGLLPETVLRRPKTPVVGFPYVERARHTASPELPDFPELGQYVDMEKVPKWPGHDHSELDYCLRVMDLQYWLLGLSLLNSSL